MTNRKTLDNLDAEFSRLLLAQAVALVRKHFPAQPLVGQEGPWTYNYGNGHWEFHGPDGFMWYGSASNGWEARYHGWMAWLKSKGIEEAQ